MIDRRALIAGALAVLAAPAPQPVNRRAYMDGLYAKLRVEMEIIRREKARLAANNTETLQFMAEALDHHCFTACNGYERCMMIVRYHEENDPDHPNLEKYRHYAALYREDGITAEARWKTTGALILRILDERGQPFQPLSYTMEGGTPYAVYRAERETLSSS